MKQTTLFKHIKGVPPPPAQQASLKSMWAKRDKSDAAAAAAEDSKEGGDVEMAQGTYRLQVEARSLVGLLPEGADLV